MSTITFAVLHIKHMNISTRLTSWVFWSLIPLGERKRKQYYMRFKFVYFNTRPQNLEFVKLTCRSYRLSLFSVFHLYDMHYYYWCHTIYKYANITNIGSRRSSMSITNILLLYSLILFLFFRRTFGFHDRKQDLEVLLFLSDRGRKTWL